MITPPVDGTHGEKFLIKNPAGRIGLKSASGDLLDSA
jgi:hypothetical protein